jgi:hypothetical protein
MRDEISNGPSVARSGALPIGFGYRVDPALEFRNCGIEKSTSFNIGVFGHVGNVVALRRSPFGGPS